MNIICENLLPIVRRITSELLMGAWWAHTHTCIAHIRHAINIATLTYNSGAQLHI